MSKERLGGKARTPINALATVSKLHVHRLPSMSEAVRLSRREIWKRPNEDDERLLAMIANRPVDGDQSRLFEAITAAERMVEGAVALDPRLAKKAQWLRRDEGEHCDTAPLAEGDDQPFFQRVRNLVNAETKAGEPVRIVVSTDDNQVPAGTAAAFIATVQIVQQFVPVEVWWQGAWLNDNKTRGFVFHVPLVQGDMDFSRLEFCIADTRRDLFSFMVMSTHCVIDLKESWNLCGHRAEKSYLAEASGCKNFVAHNGIRPEASSIAAHAALWLGWEALWQVESDQNDTTASALQSLPEKYEYKDTRTEAEKHAALADSDRYQREQQQRAKESAAARLQG
jgi:hypothetical protein